MQQEKQEKKKKKVASSILRVEFRMSVSLKSRYIYALGLTHDVRKGVFQELHVKMNDVIKFNWKRQAGECKGTRLTSK